MNDHTDEVQGSLRNHVPLICGIACSALLLIYVLFPGFLIGLLARTGVLDPISDSARAREVIDITFCVPILLAEHIEPLNRFYDWQFYLVSGYDDR